MLDGSDDDLMGQAGRGDRAAFERLVGRHFERAGRLAARVSGDRSDAEEIVQEAFLRAWLKAPDWRAQDLGGATFGTWLYRVVVNLAIDRRRRTRTQPLEAADELADRGPDGYAALAAAQIARRVRVAIAGLPERQRAALALCHFEGLSNVEAAAVLEMSVGAVESLLVRARRTLRTALADLAPSETTP